MKGKPLNIRSPYAIAAALLLPLGLLACGGDDGPDVLSESDQKVVQENLSEWGAELLIEHDDIGYGGMTYNERDRAVIGGASGDVVVPVEKCQIYADRLGGLDGPPSTVPVQIITTDVGPGDDHVLAEGAGGGQCKER